MQICFNGSFVPASQPVLHVSNRAFRYGDGIFETMLYRNDRIPLFELHMQRLFASAELLKYRLNFTRDILYENIAALCLKNHCSHLSRIRVSVYGGEGSLGQPIPHAGYVIEALPLEQAAIEFNVKGLHIGIYSGAHKPCDPFSNLKTASGLVYSLAANYAEELQWDDAIVLNSKGTVADTSIANLFIVKDGEIITPPLMDGCINGVMRRYLMDKFSSWKMAGSYRLVERQISSGDLEKAEEIFLTNALRGIRWVERFDKRTFQNAVSADIFTAVVQTIFS